MRGRNILDLSKMLLEFDVDKGWLLVGVEDVGTIYGTIFVEICHSCFVYVW